MPIYPGAKWEPITGHTDGPFRKPILGVILHVNAGSASPAGSNNDLHNFMQASSGASAVSCHFQVGKGGFVWQYIDTNSTAWCQGDGNAQYLSIESQGLAPEEATPQQVQAIGELLAWLHTTHGIPLQLAEKPGQQGFGWHGMGAAAGANWGHAACPGARKDQRSHMLMVASAVHESGGGTPIGPTPTPTPVREDTDMSFRIYQDPGSPAVAAFGGNWRVDMNDQAQIAVWLSFPDCLSKAVEAADQTHWDQLQRLVAYRASAPAGVLTPTYPIGTSVAPAEGPTLEQVTAALKAVIDGLTVTIGA